MNGSVLRRLSCGKLTPKNVELKLLPQGGSVAPLAGPRKFVASEAATLIQLRLESVPAVDKCINGIVTSWPLVVAPLA